VPTRSSSGAARGILFADHRRTRSRTLSTPIDADPTTPAVQAADPHDWWRSAVVYQVYLRSFADGDGDGVGDIAGLRSRLRYLADLGVDALWINPWYPSPMKDGGYDVSDYRDIEPLFGTLTEAEAVLTAAHELGLKVLLDIVPNHASDRHPWFQQALAAAPGSPERDRFVFRDGRGDDGGQPPNDWISQFGGPAWSRVVDPGGRPGQWYLHLYAPEQPDLNWNNPDVGADFERTLRFWFDRGVDGFRIDVAHGLVKADGLTDVGGLSWPLPPSDQDEDEDVEHPHWDRQEVHDIYRGWRALADSYPEPRVFVAEAWVSRPHRLVRYVRRDELHTAFNFEFLVAPWRAEQLRETIDRTLEAHESVGAPATWVLANHDVAREVSRYAREQPESPLRRLDDLLPYPADFGLGTRRARAAALLMLALPGGAYIYQGQELGLPEVEDLPDAVLQDPRFEQTGRESRGRDGCRVPIPWSGKRPPFGFSPPDATSPPWLPQPSSWSALSVEAESGAPDSMLELYRRALRIRRAHPALGQGRLRWLEAPAGVLVFARQPGFLCIVNLSAGMMGLPDGAQTLLASSPLSPDGQLSPDTAAWLAA
jgi:alpha-glucosidase